MKFFFWIIIYLNYVYCNASIIIPKFDARFGDKLSCIYYGLCISYKYDFDFFCPNFEYSNQLIIDKTPKLNEIDLSTFKKTVLIRSQADIDLSYKNTLYYVDFYLKMNFDELTYKKALDRFRSLILPKRKIKLPKCLFLSCPKVAVHVRKGGNYDAPLTYRKFYSDKRWPLKFPPDSYYIQQIKRIFAIFNNKPMHVHIFSDDQNPEKIVEKYKKMINQPLISFSSRFNNNFQETTIEDFFIMTKFDYLIRPQSSYSLNVQRLGKFKIVIIPSHAIITNNTLLIDNVTILKKSYEN